MSSEVDLVDLYVRAVAGFGEQLRTVGEIHWDLPTPCDDWDTRALVAHVVLGEAAVPALLRGDQLDTGDVSAAVLGPDAMATWRGTALAAIEAVRATPLDAVVAHPMGDRTVATILGFRITDNLVHSWDLATALAQPLDLDDELAEWTLDFWVERADRLAESDHFAAMREPADDSAGARLLALMGRG